MQGRLASTSAQLEKLQIHLGIAQYGGTDKTDQLAPPGTVTNDNPAAAKVRHACSFIASFWPTLDLYICNCAVTQCWATESVGRYSGCAFPFQGDGVEAGLTT